MSTIREQIDDILKKRTEKCRILEKKQEQIQNLERVLEQYESLYDKAGQIQDSMLRRQYMELFSSVSTENVREKLKEAEEKIREGLNRFERKQINIAVVGRARQGKSLFLQAVGNLDDQIVPTSDGKDCTGVASFIYNDQSLKKSEAEFIFRKKEEIVRIVQNYICVFDPNYPKIGFEDINKEIWNDLKMKKEEGNAEQIEAEKHLNKILTHFEEIRRYFGAKPYKTNDLNEIERFVSQNNRDATNFKEYYEYLAVERANIRCRFTEDCGNLTLVDTVGIGDTQYGIEDAMLNTIDQKSDAVIVITKPIAGVHEDDVRLYNQIRSRFKSRKMDKWLFYLANEDKRINTNAVKFFVENIKRGYSVCDCIAVDCSIRDSSNPESVQQKFMVPMLRKLMKNMDEMEKFYLDETLKNVNSGITVFQKFFQGMPPVRAMNPGNIKAEQIEKKGKQCYKRMTAELDNRMNYWAKEKDQPNDTLWNEAQKILNRMDELIPEAEMLQKAINGDGSLLATRLWTDTLHYVRNELTDRFIAIDRVLERDTREFKNSLVEVLYRELKHIAGGIKEDEWEAENKLLEEEDDMVEWLKEVMDHVIAGKEKYAQIYKGFKFLYNFEFNTRAQLIQEIRRQLYIINPICEEYATPAYEFRRPNAGKAVYFYLTSRISVIEDDLRYVLKDLYRTPNRSFYAAAEEFYDRLTFASDINNGQFNSMEDIWGDFFREFNERIWEINSDKYEYINEIVKEYENIRYDMERLMKQEEKKG